MVQSIGALGTTQYKIDGEGRRVAKTNSTEDTRYVYDRAGHLIAETNAAGNTKKEYVWINDLQVAVVQ